MADVRANPMGAWLDAGLGTLIEATLHRLLADSPATLRRLGRLEGKQLLVELRVPPLRVVVRPHSEGLGLGGHLEGSADARLQATLPGLLRLLTEEDALAGEGITLSGDTDLAAELRDILRDLEVDWEGLLADRIGDLPAHPLAQLARAGGQWLQRSSDSLTADLDNYLHEELAVVPARPELERYYREVDELRLAADRLQARVALLEARAAESGD